MAKGTLRTRDLSLAAYIQMVASDNGIVLLGASRSGRDRFEFRFSDPDDRGQALKIAYINSHFHTYDANVRALKKLVFSGRDDNGGGS